MSHSKAAEKRHRQSMKRRLRNRSVKSEVRSAVKKFLVLLDNGSQETGEAFKRVARLLDSAQHKGIMKRNTVARKKSRLAKRLNTMQA